MRSDQIEARAVSKIVFVALFCAALAVLLAIAVLHTRTTLQWVVTAIFLALALDPAVGADRSAIADPRPRAAAGRRDRRRLPRLLRRRSSISASTSSRSIVSDIEGLGSKLPTYVSDFEDWANNNQQFQELNDKYDITQKLNEQASSLPSRLGDGATELGHITVSLLEHLLAAITVLDARPSSCCSTAAGCSSAAPGACRIRSASARAGSGSGSPRSSAPT